MYVVYKKCMLPSAREFPTKIMLKDDIVQFVDSTIFLGLHIDSSLQWRPQIDALAVRLSSAAYAVRTIRYISDEDTARLVYYSYFHSIMSYGISLWGRAADIQIFFVLQKRAVRAIYKLKPRDSLGELYKEINILTVISQYIYDTT